MTTYIGTKTVKAKEVTVTEAETILGKSIDMSKHEGETTGYLIEYEDGYKSFSPKDVFEASYKKAETFLDRLIIERDELTERIEKLCAFLESDKIYDLLTKEEISLLIKQKYAMLDYKAILVSRIGLAVK